MRIHLVQQTILWEDAPRNRRRVVELLSVSPPSPGDLVLLAELYESGFSLNTARIADTGSGLRFLIELASAFGVTVQAGRCVIGSDGLARNHMTAVGAAGSEVPEVLADYAKIHLFSFGREPESYAPGHEVVTYRWGTGDDAVIVGPSVCYDLRFPELSRVQACRGAEVLAVGANWPAPRHEHWTALLRARAIENLAIVAGVNRTGDDPFLSYRGGSVVFGPRGEVLGELSDEEGVLSVTIDPSSVRGWRREFGALADIRLIGPEATARERA